MSAISIGETDDISHVPDENKAVTVAGTIFIGNYGRCAFAGKKKKRKKNSRRVEFT